MNTSRTKFSLKCLVVIAAGLCAAAIAAGQSGTPSSATPSNPPYLNPNLPIEQRVDDLVSRMTLQEKVLQMQHTAPAIPHLKIPAYDWWNEALHGVARSGYATVFPQAIGLGATWDSNLIYEEGRTISTEARAKYNQAIRENIHSIYFGLTFWSPNINIFRDPRWGRGQETYGEDPFLTGTLGSEFVRGMQGDNPKYLEVIATPKHYAVHSGPEPLRHGFNVDVSPHDLEDTYLPAFRMTILGAHADSLMCAYNAIDGEPACANTYLLEKTLRQAWHFQGYVTSDCGAVSDIATGHHFAPDIEHASALAVIAGTDTTCGNEYVTLVKAVHDGLIKQSQIDTAVKRLFTARMRLGMFDPASMVPFDRIPMSQVNSPAHRKLALRAARESMVLLKNNGILPLKPSVKTIAVIGPNAESLPSIEGNYNGTPPNPVLPIDGMLKEFAGKARILYAEGSPLIPELAVPVPRSVFGLASGAKTGMIPNGLKAEYFANADFSGTPALVRQDPQIQFDWNAAAPAPGIPMQAFSVRWTGTLTAPAPGDYTFSVHKFHCYRCEVDEVVRVYLDGKLVLDSSQKNPQRGNHGVILSSGYTRRPQEPTFKFHFSDTRPHKFELEYSHQAKLFGGGLTFEWKPPADVLREEAVKVAQKADVVVAFVGLSPNLEGEEMPIHVSEFDGGDRTNIVLPQVQQDLLHSLAATGKPLVVVLLNGSALAVNWCQQHAAAILEAWYPGEVGGTAIAETLDGKNNPGGRLPVTFYASVDQLPPFTDYSMRNRTYRYFTGVPLYPFGYGLSYSKFAFSGLKLSSARIEAGEPLTATVSVRNTSEIPGEEVAELYMEYPPSLDAPRRALKGFARVKLGPGETKRVTLTLNPRDLSLVNDKGETLILPGNYILFVGGGQPGENTPGTQAKFEISGRKELPR